MRIVGSGITRLISSVQGDINQVCIKIKGCAGTDTIIVEDQQISIRYKGAGWKLGGQFVMQILVAWLGCELANAVPFSNFM